MKSRPSKSVVTGPCARPARSRSRGVPSCRRTRRACRDEDQQGEAERDGGAGEHNRAAGGRHRADDGVVDPVAALELLAKAVDDEQRVVDAQCKADQLHEVRHVRRHQHFGCEDEPKRGRDRRPREQQRQRHDPRDAQREQQHDERRRDRDRDLAVAEIAFEDRLEVVLDRGLSAYLGTHTTRRARGAAQHGRIGRRVCEVELGDDRGVEQVRTRARDGPARADAIFETARSTAACS